MHTTITQFIGQGNPSLSDTDDGQVVGGSQVDKVRCDEIPPYTPQGGDAGAPGGGDPLLDPRGAPSIDTPAQNFSPYELADLLRSLLSKAQNSRLEMAKNGLESARVGAEKNTEQQLQKLQDWMDKSKEAQTLGTWAKVISWAGAVLAVGVSVVAVVAAVAVTVATGGSAAALLVVAVVGAIGVIGASIALASACSLELGGPELSFGNLVQQTLGSIMTRVFGMDPKLAENICRIVGGVVGTMLILPALLEPSLWGNMVQGACLLAGVDEQVAGYIGIAMTLACAIAGGIVLMVVTAGASSGITVAQIGGKAAQAAARVGADAAQAASKAASEAAKAASKAVQAGVKAFNALITGSSAVASGGTQIAHGGLTIAKAKSQEEGDQAVSDRQKLAANMVKLQMLMEENRKDIEEILEHFQESVRMVSQIINGAVDSLTQVVRNVGGKAAV